MESTNVKAFGPAAAAQLGTTAGLASPPSFPTPRTRIYYNPQLSEFSLGEDHPMVPHRLHLTHRLAELWGLFEDPAVQIIQDYPPATTDQLRRFHTDEYVAFLEYLDTLDLATMSVEEQQEQLGDDLAMFGLSVCRPAASGPGVEGEAAPAPIAVKVEPVPARQQQQQQQQREREQQRLREQQQQQQQQQQRLQQQQQQQQLAQQNQQSHAAAAGARVAAAGPAALKQEPKQEAKAAGAAAAGPLVPAAAAAQPEQYVPPQLFTLAVQLLAKLAPLGDQQLTPAQQQKLIQYLRQQQQQYLPKNPQLTAGAGAGAQGTAKSAGGGAAARPPMTMVRPGQTTAPPSRQNGGGGGGGGGGGSKKRKDSGGGKGGGGGKKKSKSKKRRSSYSDDDEEEEEISDEEDDAPPARAAAESAAAGAAGTTTSARPSRQAATAVAALTNAVRATEAEESDDEDSEDEEDDDDDDEGGDCPIFPGLLRYVGLQAAGSILAARDLAAGLCDVAIHWGGGMHHGMPYRAFGFCYVNDLVLAILELMAVCGRVLYIDIDVHHGDGVETAFKRSEKVLSISIHKWDDGRLQASIDALNHGKPQRPVFFPGTGKKNDLGEGQGKYYTVNVPLQDDITDESYFNVYKAVVKTAFERFRPQAVVLQCGCDSVAGDKLGRFNLSIRGHARCVELVRDLCRTGGSEGSAAGSRGAAGGGAGGSNWRIPLLVTGGGGYTPPLVARCWALETAVLLGRRLGEQMPASVAAAPDLADLGPSYFKDAELSRPPTAPYSMCLDTILLPGCHKQMDSDYSLSRLAGYLTSNMQRITIRDGLGGGDNADDDLVGGATAAGDGNAGKDGAAAAGDGHGGKDGAPHPPPAATAAAGGGRSKSRKSAASGPGVADPLKHLTAAMGYPDAEEYIQDQKQRVAESAPWAAKMPPPPAPKGRKSGAAAAAAAGGAAGGAGAGSNRAGGGGGGGGGKSAAPAGAGGKTAGAAFGAALAAGQVQGAAAAAAAGQKGGGVGDAMAAGAAYAGLSYASLLPMPHIPGLPTILPYQPKTGLTVGQAATAK